jgi:hypothetical protein
VALDVGRGVVQPWPKLESKPLKGGHGVTIFPGMNKAEKVLPIHPINSNI